MKQAILSIMLMVSMDIFAKTVDCSMDGFKDKISFKKPKNTGTLPNINFFYPVSVIIFSMRDNNLLLVAMDKDEASRPRIFISAQLDKNKQTYLGQFMLDSGSNEIQLDNGEVVCSIDNSAQ